MGEIRLGDMVAIDAGGTFGIVSGRCDRGWIVDLDDGTIAVTWMCWKVVAA